MELISLILIENLSSKIDLQKEPAFSVFSPILFWLQLTETINMLKSTQRIKTSHALQS